MNRRATVLLAFVAVSLCALHQVSSASTPAPRSPDHSVTPIQAVAISPHNQIYAGTFGRGIFASSDGGKTWTADNTDLSNQNVLAVSVKARGMVFVGTFGGGVYRSNNGNDSRWVQVNSGLGSTEVTCLEVDQNGGVYAGTSTGGVYHSVDNGESWDAVGDLHEYVNAIAVDGGGSVLVGTSYGIYRTNDSGTTWTKDNTGLTCKDVWSLVIDQHGRVFAATNGGGVFRSLDGGGSWVQVNEGLASKNAASVAVCPTGKLFVGTTEGVFVSSDDGESWSSFVANEPDNVVRCLSVGLNGQLLVGSQWINIFSSNPIQPLPEDGV